MRNLSAKADNVGDVLPATDFNALNSELENAVTSSGQTLDPEGGPDTDVEMLGKAMTIYGNASQFYQDSGAANAYVLARAGNLKPLVDYIDGVTVMFKAGNSNTGASTINVDSLGAKALRDNNDTALVGGEIIAEGYVIARYNAVNDRFEIIKSTATDLPTTSSGSPYQNVQINSDGDGYEFVGPLTAYKNKFNNPWHEIWQLGNSITVTATDTPVSDRHTVIFDGTANISVAEASLGTAIKIGHRWTQKALQLTINSKSGNTYIRLCQRIEYVTSIVDIATVLSSYIQGSGTLTVPLYARQNFGTGGSSDVVTGFSSDLSVTSSMQALNSGVAIPSVSGKTIVDTDSFLSIEYELINLAATDYVIIPYHQFEIGSIPTNPEYRHKEIETNMCHRYLSKSYEIGTNPGTTTTKGGIYSRIPTNGVSIGPTVRFSSNMRIEPSLTLYSTNSGSSGVVYNATAAADRAVASIDGLSAKGFRVVNLSAAQTDGDIFAYHYLANAIL